jgi:hypothetical protein
VPSAHPQVFPWEKQKSAFRGFSLAGLTGLPDLCRDNFRRDYFITKSKNPHFADFLWRD